MSTLVVLVPAYVMVGVFVAASGAQWSTHKDDRDAAIVVGFAWPLAGVFACIYAIGWIVHRGLRVPYRWALAAPRKRPTLPRAKALP